MANKLNCRRFGLSSHLVLPGLGTLVWISVLSIAQAESVCYGTPSRGRIAGAEQLPPQGSNFSAYSSLGVSLGRTYVHSQVRTIILAAYGALSISAPGKQFMYGETGWKSGGRFRPHRTHQNGLSADFFVPVMDSKGQSVALPINPLNKFGYGIEFDPNGQFDDYSIDFEALGGHLYQLSLAAKQSGASIAQIIFDPPYLPKLFATRNGAFLQHNVHFMKGVAWVRHDEHYHIDFSIPCESVK